MEGSRDPAPTVVHVRSQNQHQHRQRGSAQTPSWGWPSAQAQLATLAVQHPVSLVQRVQQDLKLHRLGLHLHCYLSPKRLGRTRHPTGTPALFVAAWSRDVRLQAPWQRLAEQCQGPPCLAQLGPVTQAQQSGHQEEETNPH